MEQRWFLAWVVVGAGWVLVLAAMLSIGIFVAPLVLGLTVLVARNPRSHVGMPGVVSGLGLPILAFAYVNRDGPGNVCDVTATGRSCSEQLNPLPWLVVGGALLLLGVAVFARQRRHAEL